MALVWGHFKAFFQSVGVSNKKVSSVCLLCLVYLDIKPTAAIFQVAAVGSKTRKEEGDRWFTQK